jgi:hypothetical protein
MIIAGKKLPSVAKNTVASGLDISTKPGIYINLTYLLQRSYSFK